MMNALSHLPGARALVGRPWDWGQTIGEAVVLSLVDRLPPVRRQHRQERLVRASMFAAGRAYERERLGLPPAYSTGGPTGGAAHVAASVPMSSGTHRPSARRRQHLHLV